METDFLISGGCLSATWIPTSDYGEMDYSKDPDEFVDPVLQEERAYGEL